MGLAETFQGIAQTVFTAFGNIATAATYTSIGVQTYSPTTGASTSTDTSYAVDMIFTDFGSHQIDNVIILATDKMGLIPCNNLTPTPVIMRDIVTKNNIDWDIIGEMGDPAQAIYIFHLRRPGN